MKPRQVIAGLIMTAGLPVAAATVANFDEFANPVPDFFANGGFVSGGASFSGGPFSGFVVSNVNNTTTAGFTNQYAAITGADAGGSGNYAIGYAVGSIDLPAGVVAAELKLTNTTYAALSMRDGDMFAKKFGGASGNDADFFKVTFTGYSGLGGAGSVVGVPVEFYLADYRFADNSLDYIVTSWETLSLEGLSGAASIGIGFESSDVGLFGINTPTYVAIDDLVLAAVVIPEPVGLGAAAIAGILLMRRSRA